MSWLSLIGEFLFMKGLPGIDRRAMNRVLLLVALGLLVPQAGGASPIAVSGSVRQADGSGLAEARVLLIPMASNFEWNRLILAGCARPTAPASGATDAAGRFTVEAPEAGLWRVVVEAPGFVPMRLFPLPLVESTELPPVVLLADAGVRIETRDAAGKPIPGVWTLAKSTDPAYWTGIATDGWRVGSRIARSDEHGRSVLPRAQGERLVLYALRSGKVDSGSVEGSERADFRFEQESGVRRMLEVVDEKGAPLEGLAIAAGENAWPMGITGADGRLELIGRWDSAHTVRLFAEDGRSQTVVLEPSGREPGPTRVVFRPPVRIAGRVLAETTRRPLAAALVWPGADPGKVVRTDARGAFELIAPPGERFWLQANAAGMLPRARWIERDGRPVPTVTLTLSVAASAAGEVVGPSGKPLAGVHLEVTAALPASRPQAFHPDRIVSRAVTDPRGRFRLGALQPEGSYELTALKPGFATRTVSLARPDRLEQRLRIELEKARSGFGTVVDVEDRPLAGAEVEARAVVEPGQRPREPWTAISDGSGRFDLADLSGPRLDLTARREGYAPLTVRGVEVPAGEGPLDLGTLVLEPGIELAGRVSDPAGEPLAEVEVWLVKTRGRSASLHPRRILRGKPATATGEDGKFRIGELERGESFHLFFDRPGYQTASLQGVEAPSPEPLAVVLEPASEVRGRVADTDGEPIAGAVVNLQEPEAEVGSIEVRERQPGESRSVASDELGNFVIADLVPGEVEIDAIARGFQPSDPVRLDVAPGQVIDDLLFTLERGAELQGRVTDTAGVGIAEAKLIIERASAESDADGYYRLAGIPPGYRRLRIRHPGYNRLQTELEIEPGSQTADWVLEGGWPVSGRVVKDDGTPIAGARVQLRLRERRGRREYQAMSGDDGSFYLEAVASGGYDAEVEKAGYARTEMENAVEVADGPVDDVELRLRPGASIVGRILGLDFEDLAAVQVRAQRAGRPSQPATLDYQGGYAIHDLGPGDWLVEGWLRGGSRQTEVRVAIPPGTRKVTRDLEFGRGLSLSGQVFYDEAPLAGTDVSVRGYSVAVRRSVVTDYRGAFVVEDLEPGRYRVDVSNARELVLHNRDVELLDDREVVIRISTARLSGTVTSARGGEPIAGALVRIQRMLTADGAEAGSLITLGSDEQGAFSIARVGAGRYRLAASKEGFAPAEQRVEVAAGADLEGLELVLSPTQGLDLRLRLASGAIPPSARISVLDAAGRPVHLDARYLDEQGGVHFPSAPTGTWDLLVDAPGGVARRLTAVTVRTGEPLEIVLADAGRLEVRVPDLVTANLIGSLSAIDAQGQPFRGLGPQGVLQQTFPLPGGTGNLEGLPLGLWTLRAVAPDGRSWERTVTTEAGVALRVSLD